VSEAPAPTSRLPRAPRRDSGWRWPRSRGHRPRALTLDQARVHARTHHSFEDLAQDVAVTEAAVTIDRKRRTGWYGAKSLKVPRNISLLPLPLRSPELNPQENIWQYMRQNWLSNRVFKSFDDIVDHCCFAWNTLIDQPWKIMSIARRDWVIAGQSL
jgi:transposase